MPEFYIAIILILTPAGEFGFEAAPVASYSECTDLVRLAQGLAEAQYPGADVRTACVSSEAIGQNGV